MKTIHLVLSTVMVSILAGCASTPVVSSRVGPAPEQNHSPKPVSDGSLIVRTETETYEVGDNTYYHPHTGYRIYSEGKKPWKYIPNNTGKTDETATRVQIKEGNYDIHAWSDFGPVIVPVKIVSGKTTEVNLDTLGVKGSPNPNDTSAVWLPEGKASAYYKIGWLAN